MSLTWMDDAACLGLPVDLFFPLPTNPPDRAVVRMCTGCPVREDCLAHALPDPDVDGVWGGTTAHARKVWRAARRKALGAP